jgi:long-chain fatty acid transport protein
MRNRIVFTLVIAGLAFWGVGSALATGFSIYEAGSRATALGGAFTATADDGSAMFYNAAGLSFMEGQSVDVNAMFIRPDFKFSGKLSKTDATQTGEAEANTFFVPGVYYTNNRGGSVAFGVGVYAPFGLGVEWKDAENWVGRRISHDVSIETVYVTPAVSYKTSENLALSFGLDVAHQNLNLKKYSPYPLDGSNAIHTEIDGSSDINVTPSLGLMFRPDERLSIGVMYHFAKKMKFTDQDATLTPLPGTGATWANTLVAGLGGSAQKISSEVNLPYILSVGFGYKFAPTFRAEINYVRFGWGSFEKLEMDFANDNLDQTIHFGYKNSWQIRVGAEFDINEKFSLMGGFVRDTTPQPLVSVSPLLPDSDRNDYSLGVMYRGSKIDVNLSYMAVIGEERTNIEGGEPVRNTSDYPFGTYSALANIFGCGVTYHF